MSSSGSRTPTDPPYDSPEYRSTGCARPRRALPAARGAPRPDRAGVRRGRRSTRSTATSRAATRASRSASGSSSPAACSTAAAARSANTLVEIWQANAAGRYAHEVDRHPAPLDPNFTGAGRCLTDADGQLSLRHGQARRLSVAEPSERLAAGAHPLLRLRARVRRPAGDADVLSRATPCSPTTRSSSPMRDPKARELPDRALRSRDDRARVGARPTAGTSFCARRRSNERRRRRRSGPFFTLGLRDHPCTRQGRLRLEGRVLDGAGKPVADAMVEVWSPATGWGRCGTDAEGATRSRSPRRRTSTSRCSRAAC